VAEDESVNIARRVNWRLEDQHAQMIVVDYTEWTSEGVACGETKVFFGMMILTASGFLLPFSTTLIDKASYCGLTRFNEPLRVWNEQIKQLALEETDIWLVLVNV